jgi:hypothetical protein
VSGCGDVHAPDESHSGPRGSVPIPQSEAEPNAKKPRASLAAEVRSFTDYLILRHATRVRMRPRALKERVVSLIRANLPPHPRPSGRRQKAHITKAAEMYTEQRREKKRGAIDRINWLPIAKVCVPGFDRIRSNQRRRAEIGKLRDAVYARRGKARKTRVRRRAK